ncbi:MAG TPA: DNA repair protein RecN [Candidatus Humimicrobiaceae bacterium]|nr:DNA repair protein RecN [Candidatus Humimicrobiaceae bacterium]
MLKELQVKNFAIIDDVKIKFGKGLNILTGETGAGKTLIIEAINLLIGERADVDLIRDGSDDLLVQGYFDFRDNPAVLDYLLSQNLIKKEDVSDDIVITRELTRVGRNRAFINGIFTQVGSIKKIGELFLDIHGQHDHQYLLDHKTHIEILDRFGSERISSVKKEYSIKLEEYLKSKEDFLRLKELKDIREEKLKDLNYRYEEIKNLNIKENEEEILENEVRILKNYEKIYKLASEGKKILEGEDANNQSIIDKLAVLGKNIEELAEIDNKFNKFRNQIASAGDLIGEINRYLNDYLADFDFSAERLDSIQERLFKLTEIKRKYNLDLKSINTHAEKFKEEIDSFENLDSEIEKKRILYDEASNALIEKGLALSELRKEIMLDLKNKVTDELADLGFKSISFLPEHNFIKGDNVSDDGIEIKGEKIRFTRNGIDDIEFLISLNKGETERPLRKIASGGEISRIMLALKSVIGSVDNITTMIFDEIDAGIGGAVSLIVGEKLYKISEYCQVIAITHLAQIACFSDIHYFIDKFTDGKRTKIKIKKLDPGSKIKEISRMMSGLEESDISVKHAEELLDKCNTIKCDLTERKIKIEN